MRIANETIDELVYIINETKSRTANEIINFFNQLGFNHDYSHYQNAGSKAKYTRSVLESVNGSARLNTIVEQAIHPRQYINSNVNIKEIVNKLNEFLTFDGYEIIPNGNDYSIKHNKLNPSGEIKNLIFASDGPKPEIILKNTLTYEIEVVANKQHILIYDHPITPDGLTWSELSDWYSKKFNINQHIDSSLHHRLWRSLGSDAERFFYQKYYDTYDFTLYKNLPVLIPQVYLHYDPYTIKQLNGNSRIPRQRMDFLMLLPENEKVVIEIDGKHHYTKDNSKESCTIKYAEMVSEDRKLRLDGYEIYRIGGYELMYSNQHEEEMAKNVVTNFFEQLFKKHKINLVPNKTQTTP
ncbi:AbiJ-related protein [Alkalihalobacterium bogoriense]|uniref:AbiJ-related protein n=1 Tax=Alkalihalobacterium bogoriense TaxID=246272 RepID=UPI0006872557|nr:hypothetical protein [Alkalihalobacterium bogoriense]